MARILIIEDDELLRGVLAAALELAGHVVTQAENGQAGVEMFRTSPTDLVITDLVMPVQEGIETIQQLQQKHGNPPIIAMSGGVSNSRLYLKIAGRIGATRIIAKPFTPQQLLDMVEEVLREARGGGDA